MTPRAQLTPKGMKGLKETEENQKHMQKTKNDLQICDISVILIKKNLTDVLMNFIKYFKSAFSHQKQPNKSVIFFNRF